MQEIDKLIKDALSAEDAELFATLDTDSLPELVIESFRGKSRWLVILVYAGIIALFVGCVATGILLANSNDPLQCVRYASGFVFCCLGVGLLKTWYWMELNKYAMLREMKRLELQVARLDERLRERIS